MTELVAQGTTNTTSNSIVVGKSKRLAKPWCRSEKLFPFLAEWENGRLLHGKNKLSGYNYRKLLVTDGMILTVYDDLPGRADNVPTVGLGHAIEDSDNLKTGDKISYTRAMQLFDKDIKMCEDSVNRHVKVPLYQYEYDALVSVIYNAGHGSAAIELAREVNKGNYSKTSEFIKTFRAKLKSKLQRRLSESNLFKMGVYDASH